MKQRFIFLLVILASFLNAGELKHDTSFGIAAAYYFDDNGGYTVENGFAPISYTPVDLTRDGDYLDKGRVLGSGWGSAEAQVDVVHKITMPFLRGDHFLIADNTLQFKFKGNLSPVSLEGGVEVVITPVAFLQFAAGVNAGTGWNAVAFNGLGLNEDGTGIPETTSFPGIVVTPWVNGTFQFDLAALVPGEWTHVVTQISGKIQYNYFSGAETGQAWQYKADGGQNFNGFKFSASYFLGYQMPIMLDTVGFLVETSQHLGDNANMSTMESGGWGSDFTGMSFGPLLNLTIDEHMSLATLVQWSTARHYSQETIGNKYFKNRSAIGTYIDLNRVAFLFNYKL